MYWFILYTVVYVLNTPFHWKQLSIADFAIVAKDGHFWCSIVISPQLICDVTWTCGIGIVISYHILQLFLHKQIGIKAIFTNE